MHLEHETVMEVSVNLCYHFCAIVDWTVATIAK
jgi:hypothetical protein